MAHLQLYNYFRSSTSYRARIALHLKGIDFEYKPIHLLKDEQHNEVFKKLNPLGEVPALIHNDQAIAQSLAILEFLDEVFPEPPLYPGSPLERARIRQFCENINSFLHPLGNLKVMQRLEKTYGFDQAKKDDWIKHWYKMGFETIEQMLSANAGDWCFGNQITAADLCLIPMMMTARRYPAVDLTPYKKAIEIDARAQDHEAFMKAHPFRQIDTPSDLRIP